MRTFSLKKKQTIAVDLDGVLCEEMPTFERSLAAPNDNAIKAVNQLHMAGNYIIIHTARSWSEYKMTKNWLDTKGVHYHQLICGKPPYDVVIDDRSFKSLEDFTCSK